MPLIINLILDFGRLLNIYGGTRTHLTVRAIAGYLFFFFVTVILYKMLGVLKRVEVDDNYLYVSNYLKEIKIPLSDVEFIDKPENSSHQRIKIFLRTPSEFGDMIVFMPPLFVGHEITQELRHRVGVDRDRPEDFATGKAQAMFLKRYRDIMKGKKD